MSKLGYTPPDIANTDPNVEQFEPTDEQPIRQRARMAGDPLEGGKAYTDQVGDYTSEQLVKNEDSKQTRTPAAMRQDASEVARAVIDRKYVMGRIKRNNKD